MWGSVRTAPDADILMKRQSRRALVVWRTDLAETAATPEVIEGAGRLLPRHLVFFVALGQPDLRPSWRAIRKVRRKCIAPWREWN